ncbi:MAG TPA: alpha/beta hydrolase-fold protein [Bacteroidia bacterium]|nr:alpha/beta hydrolase-fold protein [Bacteroidia bacterium]
MKITTLFIPLFFCATNIFCQVNAPVSDSSKPFVLGVTEQIRSSQLNEIRTINIYFPEGYNKNDTTRYPVIYLLDGGADEDFIHIAGLVQFSSFPWVMRLPKSIVVGIANVNRMSDFTYPTLVDEDKKRYPFSGQSDKFIAFIEKELQPFVARKYKANGTKTLIGESLGGLLATEILLKKTYLFNKYIIVSPSLWWDNASLLTLQSDIYRENFPGKADIFIGVGKEGLGPTTTPHNMVDEARALSEKLKASKSKNVKVYFDYIPEETHATISHQAVYDAFKQLYAPPAGK